MEQKLFKSLLKDVFISYAHTDFDFAENILNRLRFEGFNVWMDADLKIGIQTNASPVSLNK